MTLDDPTINNSIQAGWAAHIGSELYALDTAFFMSPFSSISSDILDPTIFTRSLLGRAHEFLNPGSTMILQGSSAREVAPSFEGLQCSLSNADTVTCHFRNSA